MQQRIQQPYDNENSSHQDMLRLLWSHAFPGEACTSLVDPRWTKMGWQQKDPSTDFRGAGLIALENLIYLAQVLYCCFPGDCSKCLNNAPRLVSVHHAAALFDSRISLALVDVIGSTGSK